jgi:dipeptidyl aminopeptidase/acylaminoacyl peptidase
MNAFSGCTRASTDCCPVVIPALSAAPMTASGMSSSVSVHAVQYLVFDSEHERLVKLAQAYPALRSEDMRPVKAVTIPARDGLALPAYLTVPVTRSAGPVPLIVFPHGGPHSRDTGTFDPWTQFFASRGWAVLQINFRGSTGQSEAFERAGFRQWGLQMQDDLTDGVGWAVQ